MEVRIILGESREFCRQFPQIWDKFCGRLRKSAIRKKFREIAGFRGWARALDDTLDPDADSYTPDAPRELWKEIKAASPYEVNWDAVSKIPDVPDDVIMSCIPGKVDFSTLTTRARRLSPDILEKFSKHVDWKYISYRYRFSVNSINRLTDHLDWRLLSRNGNLDSSFITSLDPRLDWDYICSTWKTQFSPEQLLKILEMVKNTDSVFGNYNVPKEVYNMWRGSLEKLPIEHRVNTKSEITCIIRNDMRELARKVRRYGY